MLLLLAALPYLGAIVMYWFNTAALFREAAVTAPSNWGWRMVAPVIVGGLTPLALAARSDLEDQERWLLLSATGLAILYALVSMGMLRGQKRFFRIQIPLGFGERKFRKWPRWQAIVVLGSLVLVYAAAVNVIIAGRP